MPTIDSNNQQHGMNRPTPSKHWLYAWCPLLALLLLCACAGPFGTFSQAPHYYHGEQLQEEQLSKLFIPSRAPASAVKVELIELNGKRTDFAKDGKYYLKPGKQKIIAGAQYSERKKNGNQTEYTQKVASGVRTVCFDTKAGDTVVVSINNPFSFDGTNPDWKLQVEINRQPVEDIFCNE